MDLDALKAVAVLPFENYVCLSSVRGREVWTVVLQRRHEQERRKLSYHSITRSIDKPISDDNSSHKKRRYVDVKHLKEGASRKFPS